MPRQKKPPKEIPVRDHYPTFASEEEREAKKQEILRGLYNIFTHQDLGVEMEKKKNGHESNI